MATGTLSIQIPSKIHPLSELDRERFIRNALDNPSNDEGTDGDKRRLATELYAANTALWEAFERDPDLLRRLIIAAAIERCLPREGVAGVLRAAIETLPDASTARQFFERSGFDEVLLSEYGAPVLDAIQFTQPATVVVAPDEPSAYPPDDGPLSAADIEHIRSTAAALLPKGAPLRKRSLLDV